MEQTNASCVDRQARSATGGVPCELSPEEFKLALAKGMHRPSLQFDILCHVA